MYLLTQQAGAGAGELKAVLGGNEGLVLEGSHADRALFSPLTLSPTGRAPSLQTGPDCKELRSLLSSLLEESYLLTPLAQATLLRGLVEVVSMVPAVSPVIFKAQLLRLLGTSEVSCGSSEHARTSTLATYYSDSIIRVSLCCVI